MRSNRRRLNSNVDSVFEIPRRSILNQMNRWTGGQIADEINDYLSETNPTIRVTNAFFTGNMLGIEYTAPNTDEAEDAFYYVLSDKYTPLNSSRNLNSSEQSVLTTQDIYDAVDDYVRDKVFAAVLDVQDTCQRNVIMNVVPEYDPEWCAEEWTEEDDDKQLEACTALLDLIMGGLFRHANLKD